MNETQYILVDIDDSELDSNDFELMEYEITTEKVELNKEQNDD